MLHRLLQLYTVGTNPCCLLLSHGMEDYVWDGHRCSLPSRPNVGVDRWEYQDSYVRCSAGMERGNGEMQAWERGGSVQCMK